MQFNHYVSKLEMEKYLKKSNDKLKIKKEIERHNRQYIKNNINDEIFKLSDKISLDYYQKKCILKEEEAVLLIAGAGSGKTTTIQGKIKYLLLKKQIDPEAILCISFTRKSAKQLKEKLLIYSDKIEISTFHSLGLKIIRHFNKNVKIAADDLLLQVIKSTIKQQLKKENIIYEKQILHFLNVIVCNNYTIDKIVELKNKEKNIFLKKFYHLSLLCYQQYKKILKEKNMIDYNDMNIQATNLIKNHKYKNYKYIIIDEYQDISFIRYQLIKAIINQTKAKLLAVGDDWQSIYGFSGSRIDLFTNFKLYFPYSSIMFLVNTYRNSQKLLDYTTKFILQNPNQIKKNLKSNKKDDKPIIFLYYISISQTIKNLLPKLKGKILILGRNNQDINLLKDKEIIIRKNEIIEYKNYQAKYMTVHKSKGLEYDNVIIINMKNELLGFPSQIKEPLYLNYINNETYQYAEERRLFYVALTRTKNKVYILSPLYKKSIFIKELKNIILNDKNN